MGRPPLTDPEDETARARLFSVRLLPKHIDWLLEREEGASGWLRAKIDEQIEAERSRRGRKRGAR